MGLPQSKQVFASSTEPAGMPLQKGLSLFREWDSSTHSYLSDRSCSRAVQSA